LPVSRLDAVLFEYRPGFVSPGLLQVLSRLGNAVGEAPLGGRLLGLPPFGALSLSAEIDDFYHCLTY